LRSWAFFVSGLPEESVGAVVAVMGEPRGRA
jgi:hypothetical protein